MHERHDNNFTFLRFAAASMVIVAHAYDLLNNESIKDPVNRVIGRSLGWIGVSIFFSMSGYLIMRSLDRTPNLLQFGRSRALRIFPGLAVCTIVTIFFLSFFSSLPAIDYFSSGQTLKFLVGNSSLLSIQYVLPGVFEHNPMAGAVNGSLWTLPYEVLCYILAAAACGFGLLQSNRQRIIIMASTFVAILLFAAIHEHLPATGIPGRLFILARLGACFLVGMAYASFRERFHLRLWHGIALAAIAAATSKTPLYDITLSTALAAVVLWLAFVPSPTLRRISRLPDYSYGIYIYAFPIQQLILDLVPTIPPAAHAIVAFLLVLVPASLSWHLIEKPALRLKNASFKKSPTLAAEQD